MKYMVVYQKEEMELRAAMRSRAATRRARRGGGAAAGGGRGARDDSEDEGGVSLAAIKNKYKAGQKGDLTTCGSGSGVRDKITFFIVRL
ncbi:hypothetical protein RR48_07274 [Papilio machaon]|uniref:Uncharacterized protein n=1 Tax=Papilio machaon TaxID=76193 RepID=A0A194RMJ3_PAPMA|nr:hypothetical protein RR48_07274 [Papilio machaon]